ncbi:MAG TPA: TetR/AcrR family transcriptional regulator [Bryobacteraceae bacterium]|nr:TetR/AcrR family transcriptional regulator [Bryobacteraceae bacterium]
MDSDFSSFGRSHGQGLRLKNDPQHPIIMRYGPKHKLETHQKIVKDASRRVRAEGLSGAAVSAVMKDAGLTHGGFYKHFSSKDDLLLESLREGFREIEETLVHAAEQSPPGEAWKAVVRTYLSLDLCDHPERGCPLAALSPELARADKKMKPQIVAELVSYKTRMLPFMPGARSAEKERAFFVIFSTMIGAVEIARMLPDRAVREKVLAGTRDFLLRSFAERPAGHNPSSLTVSPNQDVQIALRRRTIRLKV